MSFCPNCGSQVQEMETFCVSCGKRLPEDILKRKRPVKPSKKWWFLPVLSILIACLIIGSVYVFQRYQTNKALSYFNEAEEMAQIGDYKQALTLIDFALEYKERFPAAEQVGAFLKVAIQTEDQFKQVKTTLDEHHFQQSFDILQQSEESLQHFNGDLVDQLMEQNMLLKNQTMLAQATYQLSNDPSRDDLKTLLWEIQDISEDQAADVKSQITEKLVSMTYKKATALLNDLQFSKALLVIDDTMKVIESSEQLESLKTTINKEKTAFESAQEERIEQAITAFEEEQELNESHAIELKDIQLQKDKDTWKVTGELKSVATVPIHSILVKYTVYDEEENALVDNEVYVFPETLYPNEVGKFEFTHYDMESEAKQLTPKMEEITWYLD
ncbi:zinc ribbon domain-containing protein [Gracilibacillus caseinilyticus]|uniref:Zinc ribbon domain-containing protein n=1 Tax=Gracilibacillus caseinilyticus TaxID=2932256 RepID=A0ABY4EUD3_9BACI|nr:zinc-ribbon domain-containing protein [Gracilibacillus caseinilyticus]UOQ48025.1 zinc ribbon domain-containing protein [Gracilibacillus caseinilyticus]